MIDPPDTQPAHYALTPGDDLHLGLLMVPYAFNEDHETLLAFARDVWAAAVATQGTNNEH